jgi:hypothetical protein
LKDKKFFVVPFVLLMLWFLGNIVVSSVIYSSILGHYEVYFPAPAGAFIWVANDMTEILEWSTLIFGSVTFLSALASYLIYKALKNP